MRTTAALVFCLLCITSAASTSAKHSAKSTAQYSYYVDLYAPVIDFTSGLVKYYPTNVLAPASSTYCENCGYHANDPVCYVNVVEAHPHYTFQYWYYYTKDLRIPNVETVQDSLLESLNYWTYNWMDFDDAQSVITGIKLDQFAQIQQARKLVHDHDWELIEVVVDGLGNHPEYVVYYAHGKSAVYSFPDVDVFLEEDNEYRVHALVATDQHGMYPTKNGSNYPFNVLWWDHNGAAELTLAKYWVQITGAYQDIALGVSQPYWAERIDFRGKCLLFDENIIAIEKLNNYPYYLPWDQNRDFRYESPLMPLR